MFRLNLVRISDGLVTDLVQGIRGVGDQLAQKDLLVGVEGIDDEASCGKSEVVPHVSLALCSI